MKNAKLKLLENGPIRLSVESDEEVIKNVLFDSRGKSISIKKNSILCRCGKSKQQPFCDGVHRMCGFTSSDKNEETYDVEKIVFVKGAELNITTKNQKNYSLCRCGASQNLPFCDEEHISIKSKKYTF